MHKCPRGHLGPVSHRPVHLAGRPAPGSSAAPLASPTAMPATSRYPATTTATGAATSRCSAPRPVRLWAQEVANPSGVAAAPGRTPTRVTADSAGWAMPVASASTRVIGARVSKDGRTHHYSGCFPIDLGVPGCGLWLDGLGQVEGVLGVSAELRALQRWNNTPLTVYAPPPLRMAPTAREPSGVLLWLTNGLPLAPNGNPPGS
jgi:hypothetical protein